MKQLYIIYIMLWCNPKHFIHNPAVGIELFPKSTLCVYQDLFIALFNNHNSITA